MKKESEEVFWTKSRENFLRCIIDGKIELSEKEILARQKKLGILWLKPKFLVVSIAPDFSNVEYDYKDKLIYEYELYVYDKIKEYGYDCYCFITSYNSIQVILSLYEKEMGISDVDALFLKLHKKLYAHFDLNLFIGVGSVADSLAKIHISAQDSHRMLSYKYQYADNGVANISNMVKFRYNTSIANEIAFDRVIGCFQDGNLERMEKRLCELIEEIRRRPNVSKTSIRRTFIELVVRILHIASNAGVDVDNVLGDVDPYHWILQQNHTEIMVEWLMGICAELVTQMKIHKSKKENEVISLACDYIEKNLHCLTLGLRDVSEAVGLSYNYCSQLFEKEIGIGVNSYIINLRLESAKKLLIETNMKSNEIATKVGFSTPGYFGQVFKKNVGVSPGQYRRSFI